MDLSQGIALLVLVGVVIALISGRLRSDVVALAGAAVLIASGVVRPSEAQAAFASPAIVALASLFVIGYAMELSGLLDFLIRAAIRMCERLGEFGVWVLIVACGGVGLFLNNTPIVVLASPVVRDVAVSLRLSPKRFLIPLSYITVLGGTCTLIGTSTNLLVNDMARSAGQPAFSLFEITPVGLTLTLVGTIYVLLVAPRLLAKADGEAAGPPVSPATALESEPPGIDSSVADPSVFVGHYALQPVKAALSLGVFVAVVAVAAVGLAPIAASAFAGAVLLILLRVVSAEEAYRGLRPEILMLIAGMVVVGLSLELSGLAGVVTDGMVSWVKPFGPRMALILLYGATLFLTEILSNAAVAVLVTPIAVGLAESLGVNPRPFLVAVMMGASAAFATPFGYQTNVIVFQMGRYSYMDFVRIGVPLNLLTWAVAVTVIPLFFPF